MSAQPAAMPNHDRPKIVRSLEIERISLADGSHRIVVFGVDGIGEEPHVAVGEKEIAAAHVVAAERANNVNAAVIPNGRRGGGRTGNCIERQFGCTQ